MNGHKYVLFKYRIFDLLTQSYYSSEYDSGIYYDLEAVAYEIDYISKHCVETNRYEVHAIKLCDIQTLAE